MLTSRDARLAQSLLSMVTPAERAAAIVGDLHFAAVIDSTRIVIVLASSVPVTVTF